MKYGIYGEFSGCSDYSCYIAVADSYLKALEEISRLTQTQELKEHGLYCCYIVELKEKKGLINLEKYPITILHKEDMSCRVFIHLKKELKKYGKHEKMSEGFCILGYNEDGKQVVIEKVYTDLEEGDFFDNNIIFEYWHLKYFPNESFEDIKEICAECGGFKSKDTSNFIIAQFDLNGTYCACSDN